MSKEVRTLDKQTGKRLKTEDGRVRRGSNSRQKIINAALFLFAKYGYEKTTIRMIAQKAGVSLGLMYNYFDGKDELL